MESESRVRGCACDPLSGSVVRVRMSVLFGETT